MKRSNFRFDALDVGINCVGGAIMLEMCGNWSCASSSGVIALFIGIICTSVVLSPACMGSEGSSIVCNGKKTPSRET